MEVNKLKKLSVKIISIALSICLLIGIVPMSIFAEVGDNNVYVDVTLEADKTDYADGDGIVFNGAIANSSSKDCDADVEISLYATPSIKLDTKSLKVNALAAGESHDLTVEATANRIHFGFELIQAVYDIITGYMYTIVFEIVSLLSSNYECVRVYIDGVPAAVMYKVDSSVVLKTEEETTEPEIPTEPEEPTEPGTSEPSEGIESDADGDGLSNEEEDFFGTDKNNKDTDSDDFTDYEEVYLMGTDPLSVNDGDNDTDEDGLSDYDEVKRYNTDINSSDTDVDGLSDYDEVMVYGTDPTKKDTDGDGLSDAFEIENGLDPKKESTDGITNDGDLKISQEIKEIAISDVLLDEENEAKPSINGEVSGEMSENIFIASANESDFDGNRALVGKAVYIDADDEYVAGLTLEFDLSDYEGDISTLSVCTLDEDGNIELVDSSKVDGTTVSCTISESTTYFVMDIEEFLKNLDIYTDEYSLETSSLSTAAVDTHTEIATEKVSGQADIVFVIDTTGSMSDEIYNVKSNVADFTERLSTDYNVKVNYALIDFRDLEEDGPGTTKVIKNGSSNWYSDVDSYKNALNKLSANGGGDTPECDVDALETARRLDFRPSANKFIILITDASYKNLNDYGISSMSQEIGLLVADEINVSVVSPTNLASTYSDLYTKTGGMHANIYGDFSAELLKLADLIGEETSDGEWVILKRGFRYVKLPALPEAGSTVDTDEDGITDYIELGSTEIINLTQFIKAQLAIKGVPFEAYYGKTTITVYNSIADPTLYDTDNDGINDCEDTAPWKKGDKNGYIGTLTLLSCEGDSVASIPFGGSTGHAFLIYTSSVKDTLDTSGFNRVMHKNDGVWKYSGEYGCSTYGLELGKSISIGANGIDDWIDECDNDYGAYCATINVEVWKYSNGVSYQPNSGITQKVTQVDLEKLLKYFASESKKNYSPFSHQCAHVATGAWDKLYNQKFDPIGMNTPKAIKNAIEKAGGTTINLDSYNFQALS